MCPPNKSIIQWLPVSPQYQANWRYSPFLKSGAAKRGTRLMLLPDPLLNTTPKPVTLNTRSKNSTLTRHSSLTYGNPFITKLKRNKNINTSIYKTESTLLQIHRIFCVCHHTHDCFMINYKQ